jgi:pyruvate dehydrogenase E2 component (dihydrolipoamide acetyltransferase)
LFNGKISLNFARNFLCIFPMAEVLRMPKMSDTMTEGVIAVWHKKIGDSVRSGDILADVETDKATMELENFVNGVLLHVGVAKGGSVPVDAIIAIVGKEGEDISALLSADETSKAIDSNGASSASSATSSASSASSAGSMASSSSTDAKPQTGASGVPVSAPAVQASATLPSQAIAPFESSTDINGVGRTKASPLARKMAQERGIDLSRIQGSGDHGRIVRRDLESVAGQSGTTASYTAPENAFIGQAQESFELVAISPMRKTIARRLAESKFTAPHFYLNMEVDMDRAVESRARLNELSGTKISFNDLLLKAVAMSLPHHPAVNASWLDDNIRYNRHVHLGVAMAVEDGLLVPVVRFANHKSLSQIALETASLADRARQKKLQPSDWEGNTFTISNLGMFGIESFTAIINPPDSCILAGGAIRQEAVVRQGELAVGHRMKLTLSCDHRVVDGATGAAFLQRLKNLLEEPLRMLL